MKLLDLALNGITALAAAVFIAYLGLRNGKGLFTSLPDNVAEIFIHHEGLQFVALFIIVGALVAKVPVMRALKRRKTESRM